MIFVQVFEPVECFENRSDVVMFLDFSNSFLNSLEVTYFGDIYVQEETIAVV